MNSMLEEAHSLCERARGINTRDYEQSDPDSIARDLVPVLAGLLNEAEIFIRQVFGRYNADESAEPADSADQHGSDGGSRLGDQRIADLAFVARLELGQARRNLGALAQKSDSWEYIALCAGIRRRLLESLSALELAMCVDEGRESSNDWYRDELRLSLEVRRVYAVFNKALQADEQPDGSTVYHRLRQTGVALAKLIGRDVYEDLRIRDRQMLRTQQRSVVAWLRQSSQGDAVDPHAHARAGIRLWTDTVGLARMLLQVSNRSELRIHDARVLSAAWQALFDDHSRPAERIPESLLVELGTVYGLNPDLDRCIEAGAACPINDWEIPLLETLQLRQPLH